MDQRWGRSVDRKISNLVSRGSLTSKIDDGEVQTADVTIYPGQNFRGVLRAQQYGFTSSPSVGAEIVWVCEDGSQELPIVVSADHPALRPKILEWESCQWTKFGTHVWLKADQSLDIKAKNLKMVLSQDAVITSPKFAVKGASAELIATIYEALTAIKTAADGLVAGGGSPVPGSAMAAFSTGLTPVLAKLQPFIVS